jgi:hypothetical protein
MLLSSFAPLSLMRLSGREPDSRRIYQALIDGFGGLDSNEYALVEGSRLEAWCFATALGIARTRMRLRQVVDQFMPLTAVEGLPLLEDELGLIPSPLATIAERRQAVAQRALAPVVPSKTNVIAALTAILGSALQGYHTTTPTAAHVWPTNLGDAPMNLQRASVPRKIVTLAGAVSFTGTPVNVNYTIPYLALPSAFAVATGAYDASMVPKAGDVFVFDVGRTGQMDRVTIAAAYAPSDGPGRLTAPFTRPHEAGVMGFTHPIPYWMSDQRHVLVVVTTAAAENAELRRQVNEYMRRTLRGSTTWDMVEGSSTATTAFALNSPSLSQRTLQAVTV